VKCRRFGSRFAAEQDAGRADPELVEVDPECLRVLVVVGMQGKPLYSAGIGLRTRSLSWPPPSSGYGSELMLLLRGVNQRRRRTRPVWGESPLFAVPSRADAPRRVVPARQWQAPSACCARSRPPRRWSLPTSKGISVQIGATISRYVSCNSPCSQQRLPNHEALATAPGPVPAWSRTTTPTPPSTSAPPASRTSCGSSPHHAGPARTDLPSAHA
jgi:hypothetical protein